MTQYYKITNENELHHGFQYKDGENILNEPFNTEGPFCKGGFYFTDAENISKFCHLGCYLRLVTIPEDAQMVKETNKFSIKWKSDKIIFRERYPLYSLETMENFPFLKTLNYFNKGLEYACKEGHLELARLMIENGAKDFNGGLRDACRGGHLELDRLMIENGAKDFNGGLRDACRRGHLELARLMIENGANDFNSGLISACSGGHLELAQLMIDKYAKDFNIGLYHACSGGHLELAQLMIKYGADDFIKGLNFACQEGHLELEKLMIEKKREKDF